MKFIYNVPFLVCSATASSQLVSVLNALHENLGTAYECSCVIFSLCICVHAIYNYLCGSFTVLMLGIIMK